MQSSATAKGREWIKASHFHALTEVEVLNRVRELAQKVEKPTILFDLDSTLYEVGPRTFQIIREWCEHRSSEAYPSLRSAFVQLELHHVGYSLRETVSSLGLNVAESAEMSAGLEVLKGFWSERFFSSTYLRFDRAYPGAAHFAQELYNSGLTLIYLTGRDEPRMGDGTRKNLLRDGFPWEVPRTHLLLKSHFEKPDLEHKKSAAEFVRKHGTLVASFENEPVNLVALAELFPQAMHIFLDTVYSDHDAPIGRELYRIQGFGSLLS